MSADQQIPDTIHFRRLNKVTDIFNGLNHLGEFANNGGDRVKADAWLDGSLAISSELGMRPLMERVLSRREILWAWVIQSWSRKAEIL